ncbi:MAG: beta-ketoacyl synthase chain length factor [Muribaculaceae bacterium]|nr:beta-ketoacyl synthase chain length factor [Muribaculaceae bacterium]
MSRNKCYILSASQVSCQKPLCDEWMLAPERYEASFARALEPDTREYIVPSEARRMSRILKRAVCTSISALNASGIQQPDAIITGTAMGCAENSEKFLIDLSRYGEQCLKPTLFMQSTHNTISSLIAIILKCHGYNNTYSQNSLSFESALFDAWLQLRLGRISSALVGAHDELTPFMALVAQQLYPQVPLFSEASVSAILSAENTGGKAFAEVVDVKLLHRPSANLVAESCDAGPDTAVLIGNAAAQALDAVSAEVISALPCEPRAILKYDFFGAGFSASALGFYAAATMLRQGYAPAHACVSGTEVRDLTEIVCLNRAGSSWSIVKLRKI